MDTNVELLDWLHIVLRFQDDRVLCVKLSPYNHPAPLLTNIYDKMELSFIKIIIITTRSVGRLEKI